MDGDKVFISRPPMTHIDSLPALFI